MAAPKKRESAINSVVAGMIAGAVEPMVTYPAEFAKSRSQLERTKGIKPAGPVRIVLDTYRSHGLKGIYSGCTALIAGNSLKAGVRFLAFDQFKAMMADDKGKLTGPRSLLAGLGAGVSEAIFAVTPSETIKTKLIDDQKRPQPKYRGLLHGTRCIVQEEGITGIYRGLFPVLLRQGANSTVRFGTYSTLKQFVQGNTRPGQNLPTGVTFGIGAVAGVVTVYATMPLDVIKTQMQSLEARQRYRSTIDCASKIFQEEGLRAFWRGATPRLARLILSGGIVFTVYEKVIVILAR